MITYRDDLSGSEGKKFRVIKSVRVPSREAPRLHDSPGDKGTFGTRLLRAGDTLIFKHLDTYRDIWYPGSALVFEVPNSQTQVGIQTKDLGTNWSIDWLEPFSEPKALESSHYMVARSGVTGYLKDGTALPLRVGEVLVSAGSEIWKGERFMLFHPEGNSRKIIGLRTRHGHLEDDKALKPIRKMSHRVAFLFFNRQKARAEKYLRALARLDRAAAALNTIWRRYKNTPYEEALEKGYPPYWLTFDRMAKRFHEWNVGVRKAIEAELYKGVKQADDKSTLEGALSEFYQAFKEVTDTYKALGENRDSPIVAVKSTNMPQWPNDIWVVSNQVLMWYSDARMALKTLAAPKPPSARELLAERIAAFISRYNLDNPYGGDVALDRSRQFYNVLFSYPGNLDGVVKVYSPRFIQVKYQTRYLDLPNQDSRIFTSEKNALDFLKAAFVDLDFEKALAIPAKARKS